MKRKLEAMDGFKKFLARISLMYVRTKSKSACEKYIKSILLMATRRDLKMNSLSTPAFSLVCPVYQKLVSKDALNHADYHSLASKTGQLDKIGVLGRVFEMGNGLCKIIAKKSDKNSPCLFTTDLKIEIHFRGLGIRMRIGHPLLRR